MATSPARSKARSASSKPAAKRTRKTPAVKKSDAKPPENETTPETAEQVVEPPPGAQQSGVMVLVRYNDGIATIVGVGEVGETRPSEIPYLLERAVDVWKAAQKRGGG